MLRLGWIGAPTSLHYLEALRDVWDRVYDANPNVRLKIVSHHGSFLELTVGGREQAVGADVILAHRLLKNGVADRDHYALFTRSALASMGIDPARAGFVERTESYEHFGDVPCFVMTAPPHEPAALEAVEPLDAHAALS